jgi:hypothetical protein
MAWTWPSLGSLLHGGWVVEQNVRITRSAVVKDATHRSAYAAGALAISSRCCARNVRRASTIEAREEVIDYGGTSHLEGLF